MAILDNTVLQVPFSEGVTESKRVSNAISFAMTPEDEDSTEMSELNLDIRWPNFVDVQVDEVSVSFFD